MPTRKGHGTTLSYYHFGRTTMFASRRDPQIAYCLYVPEGYEETGVQRYPLVVLVHGTERAAQSYRDAFAAFAEAHSCIILAPLFPAVIDDDAQLDNYKFLEHDGIRYDLALLHIVDEVASVYRIYQERIYLHGFSGGGHFAHRFYYLHADRLHAVSIGAPGVVTLLDERCDWWVGTQDLERVFGRRSSLEELRRVAVQMVIGGVDTETWEINEPGRPGFVRGQAVEGVTRLERMSALKGSFENYGIEVRHDVIPNVAHVGWDLLPAVQTFFADIMATRPVQSEPAGQRRES